MSTAGATTAILAAQAAARQQREEEAMAQYTAEELAEGWEFKFLRSACAEFKSPEKLREYLEEEGRAGWTLVEKFDSKRLRLKRPAAAKARDSQLSFDAYRTSVGMSEGALAMMVVGGMLLLMGAIVVIVVLVKGP